MDRPILVVASVGSYGTYLADGSSKYSGDYGDNSSVEFLKGFHRRRVQVLAECGADLIAFERVPNKLEAQAFAELLEEGITIPAWFSFICKDGLNMVSGDSLAECAAIADSCKNVVAIGINCTPPRFISALIPSIQKQPTAVTDQVFALYVMKWCENGASVVGGCCGTTIDTIKAIYRSPPKSASATLAE